MADYKKYAENLIGNWEKDIYVPQRDITKEIYQTNWDKLTSDYNRLNEQLARNFENAKMDYAGVLGDVQDNSFNRMNLAYNDLANRGLSASGAVNDLVRADTKLKGQEVDKALSDLMKETRTNITGLNEGVNAYGAQQTELAAKLADDLGKFTDADAANNQQYAGLVGGIAEGAASRAASRASSNASYKLEKAAKVAEDEISERYRKLSIYETLNDNSLTDEEKLNTLVMDLDVPRVDANAAISSMNYTKTQGLMDALTTKLKSKGKSTSLTPITTYTAYSPLERLAGMSNTRSNSVNTNQLNNINGNTTQNYTQLKPVVIQPNKKLVRLNNELSKYTYTDLYDLLYNK